MRAIILATMVMASPASVEQQQFDLVCTAKKSVVRYRIDLTGNRYCAGDCKTVRPIVEASASALILERHEPAFRSDYTSRTEINRTTGEWHTYFDTPGVSVIPFEQKGLCESAAFTGMPARKF